MEVGESEEERCAAGGLAGRGALLEDFERVVLDGDVGPTVVLVEEAVQGRGEGGR
jgi:hypothetical protein